jgi:hypothetical protein
MKRKMKHCNLPAFVYNGIEEGDCSIERLFLKPAFYIGSSVLSKRTPQYAYCDYQIGNIKLETVMNIDKSSVVKFSSMLLLAEGNVSTCPSPCPFSLGRGVVQFSGHSSWCGRDGPNTRFNLLGQS